MTEVESHEASCFTCGNLFSKRNTCLKTAKSKNPSKIIATLVHFEHIVFFASRDQSFLVANFMVKWVDKSNRQNTSTIKSMYNLFLIVTLILLIQIVR